jgi:predicted nucleotidyltransferase
MFDAMIKELSALPQVEAIALGGSRAGSSFDEKSDYDIYLYCTAPVTEDIRKEILSKYCSYVEYSNHYWELEDNGTFNNGVDFDLLFRNLDDFTADVASVVEYHQARNGYTTCMWHNLLTCKILYDENGRLKAAKDRFSVPYPQELKQNIISRNRALLWGSMPAYEDQINKAVKRGDLVSINHRVAAFMESYFDLLFALNEQTHPGEKRLMQLSSVGCQILPRDFQENLTHLFTHLYTKPEMIAGDLGIILSELEKIL